MTESTYDSSCPTHGIGWNIDFSGPECPLCALDGEAIKALEAQGEVPSAETMTEFMVSKEFQAELNKSLQRAARYAALESVLNASRRVLGNMRPFGNEEDIAEAEYDLGHAVDAYDALPVPSHRAERPLRPALHRKHVQGTVGVVTDYIYALEAYCDTLELQVQIKPPTPGHPQEKAK